ncbi:MAG: glycosyl hydrolase [Dehalococcoidia bacterium]|nr:glycosyl hydrolase [Dehalococcoidia bacterium]
MTPLNGIHWRNTAELEQSAWDIMEAGQFHELVVLSNAGPELPIEIHRRYPSAQIIARLYWPAGDLPSVDQAVKDASTYIARTYLRLFVVGNEPDTENPGMTPEQFSEWFIAVRSKLAQRFGCEYGFPMPSVQGVPSWEYAVRCAAGIAQADFIAEHCYWINDEGYYSPYWGGRYHLCHLTWPDKPIHITEYGNADPALDGMVKAQQYKNFMRTLPDYVSSAHVFIQAGAPDWDKAGFGVTKEMAELMRQGIVPPVAGSTPYDPYNRPENDTEGDGMATYAQARVFTAWRNMRDAAPMFQKVAAEKLALGAPICPEQDDGTVRWQPNANGLILAPVGQWEKTVAVINPQSASDLPDFT